MQTQAIVTRLLQCFVPFMHAARWQALRDVANAAICGKALTLTALALGTTRDIHLRETSGPWPIFLASKEKYHGPFNVTATRTLARFIGMIL